MPAPISRGTGAWLRPILICSASPVHNSRPCRPARPDPEPLDPPGLEATPRLSATSAPANPRSNLVASAGLHAFVLPQEGSDPEEFCRLWPRPDQQLWAIELLKRKLVHSPGGVATVPRNRNFQGVMQRRRPKPAQPAGDAHVARGGRSAGRPVDDEVISFGLSGDGLAHHRIQVFVTLRRDQRRPQIGCAFVASTQRERACASRPHAIANIAETVCQRRDEADEAAGFSRMHKRASPPV